MVAKVVATTVATLHRAPCWHRVAFRTQWHRLQHQADCQVQASRWQGADWERLAITRRQGRLAAVCRGLDSLRSPASSGQMFLKLRFHPEAAPQVQGCWLPEAHQESGCYLASQALETEQVRELRQAS